MQLINISCFFSLFFHQSSHKDQKLFNSPWIGVVSACLCWLRPSWRKKWRVLHNRRPFNQDCWYTDPVG